MLQLRIKHGRRNVPLYALPDIMGRQEAVEELGDQIDALITYLDTLQGDIDLEDGEADMTAIDDRGNVLPGALVIDTEGADREPDEDAQGDQAWVEWHTMRGHQKRGHGIVAGHEDDEDDDPAEDGDSDRDASGDDWIASGSLNCGGILFDDTATGSADDDEHSAQPAYSGLTGLPAHHPANDT